MTTKHVTGLLAAALVAGGALAPTPAAACGGFFCSASPVDQEAERIVFAMDGEKLHQYVEINYLGAPEDFAWVLPVPEAPELDVWHGRAFQALDLATQPQINPPWECIAVPEAAADGAGGGDPDDDGAGAVEVLQREQVGPFAVATIRSDDPQAAVDWLRDENYRIVPAMEPFIALYTDEGMAFTAMKLLPGEDVDSIQPVKMSFTLNSELAATVPLRLTSVAAVLEMGIKVWVLGDRRYNVLNMPSLEIDPSDIVFDGWTYKHNYEVVVARMADEAGGSGFVTEYAAPTGPLAQQIRDGFVPDRPGREEALEAQAALADLLDSHAYVTRLYTRLSPEEMDVDPLFGPAAGGDVSNVIDIPAESVEHCGEFDHRPDPCEFEACGAVGGCFPAEEDAAAPAGVGCACADGAVARAVPDNDAAGGARVGCGDARMNFEDDAAGEGADVGGPTFVAACMGNPCGAGGECLSLNGFQACRCDRGFVAIGERDAQGMAMTRCVPAAVEIPDDFYLVSLPEPNLPFPGRIIAEPVDPGGNDDNGGGDDTPGDTPDRPLPGADTDPTPADGDTGGGSDDGCAATPGAPAGTLPLFALVLLGAVRRRRRA